MHRSHEELARNAASQIGAGLQIHPVVGTTKPGDVDHYTRIRSYKALAETAFEPSQCALSLLTLAMRMAGPRDALLGSIISRNFGCTHFMVGPDHASPGLDSSGNPFYKTYAAQEFTKKYQDEIGISLISFKSLVYLPDLDQYASPDEIPDGTKTADITADQVRDDYLAKGIPLPAWFSRPVVSTILSETNPPKHKQGLTIWFTGLSGSGKSTIAHGLVERLAEYGRNVAFLDGDEIRTHLSKGLGFSKEDRDTNIHRVGYVAGLLAAQGGTTICSVVSPYRAPRDHARTLSRGNFVEIFCDTPIDICETRDVKGLYAKARAAVAGGKGLGFTGVDDPYEPPTNPEVTLDTSRLGVAECVEVIVGKLKELGFIRG
jgi:sulfate adenylyltransferase